MVLWWRRPDLLLQATGTKTWEIRANSPRGRQWLFDVNANGAPVESITLQHDAALEVVFRAIRDGLIVCSSDPKR